MPRRPQPLGRDDDARPAPPRRSPPSPRAAAVVAMPGMAEHAGQPRPERRADLRQQPDPSGGDAAAPLADIHLDQRADRPGMRGDGAGHLQIVGDDLDVGPRRIQRRHRIQLGRDDADGIDLVVPAGLGEIPRLGQGADRDRAEVRRRRASPPRCSSRSSDAAAAPARDGGPPPPASPPGCASARPRSSTRQGVGRSSRVIEGSWRPARLVVQRQHRPRQPGPGEARQDRRGQPRGIHLDDPVMGEELVEAAAEMPARLHHHRPRRADIEAQMLEEGRIGALASGSRSPPR